jgi:hypothetical protein
MRGGNEAAAGCCGGLRGRVRGEPPVGDAEALRAALERPEKLTALPTAKAKGTRMLAGFPEVAVVQGGPGGGRRAVGRHRLQDRATGGRATRVGKSWSTAHGACSESYGGCAGVLVVSRGLAILATQGAVTSGMKRKPRP